MPPPSPDDLFDLWLDAALAGEPEDPGAFCKRHGAGPELQLALERIHDQMGASATGRAASTASASTAGPDEAEWGGGTDGQPRFENLGGYRLIRTLGQGGMGTVYLAEDPGLDRLVAVKVLRPEYLGSPTAEARFEQEARAVARLRHPHVVTLLHAGQDRDVRYLVMELVPGRSLDEVLRGDPVPPHRVLRWIHEVAQALACAHSEGIVHRDVKPSNIRIDPMGRAVLLDFGLARDLLDTGPTRTRAFAGSPQYASPEQRAEDRARMDHRTDVYSLGVVLYEGLSGSLPYEGTTLESVVHNAAVSEPIPVRKRNPKVARDVAVVVGKAMERDPEARYASAAALADDIQAVLELRPIRARPPSALTCGLRWARRNRAVVAAVVVMGLLLAAVVGSGMQSAAQDLEERRKQARGLVEAARREIADYAARRDRFAVQASRAYDLVAASKSRYITPDEHAFLQLHSLIRARHWGGSDALFADLLRKLQTAQELDPDTPEIADVWSEFWFQRWWDLRTSPEWSPLAAFFRSQIESLDQDGDLSPRLQGAVTVAFRSDPPGAQLHVFRCVEQAAVARAREQEPVDSLYGDRRAVPVPIAGDDPNALLPGTTVLRVARGGGEVVAGDVIVKVGGQDVVASDGDRLEGSAEPIPVTVWRRGNAVTVQALGVQRLRASACQPLISGASRVGETPVDCLALESGEYLAVLTLDGHEDLVLPFVLPYRPPEKPLHRELVGRMLPLGSSPDGFVRVSDARGRWPGIWIQEREVHCGEYLEFLNRGGRAAEGRAPRVAGGPAWVRQSNGAWRLPSSLRVDQPVVGVSWDDAQAYCAWWNASHEFVAAGVRYTARLPTRKEWRRAAGAVNTPSRREYPFGDYFAPHWCGSRFAHPEPVLRPARSHLLDESLYGAYDMAGSVAEWCSGYADEDRVLRPLLGGSWQDALAEVFRIDAVRAVNPTAAGLHTGFRMVWAP